MIGALRFGRRLIVVLGACFALLSAPVARGQTLLDTFGPGNTFTTAGTVGGSASTINAVRFTVPAGGDVSLVRVDMALAIGGTVNTAQVGIFNESGGLPVGMPIAFANIPGPLSATMSFQSAPFSSPPTLLAGHNYWAAPIITGSGSIFWGAGLMGTTTAAFFNGSTWASETPPNPLAIRVSANAAQVACCNPHGTGCLMLLQSDCATIGGVANVGSTCATTVCAAIVTGACCHGATCQLSTSLACAISPPGRFLGYAVACTPVVAGGPNPCCAADFNNSGALSVQDIFDFLAAWFAGCP